MRLGCVRPVHCKALPSQEIRAVLTARKILQTKLHDLDMSLRGILRGFGLKVGQTTPRTFAGRIRELVEGHPTLEAIAASLLKARDVLRSEEHTTELQSLMRHSYYVLCLKKKNNIG